MQVNPGELDKQIQIIKKALAEKNENGFPIIEESVVRKCWAKVSQISGKKLINTSNDASYEFSNTKVRFLVRYSNTKIDNKMIIKFRGKEYNIKYVNEYGYSKEYIEIWTELCE